VKLRFGGDEKVPLHAVEVALASSFPLGDGLSDGLLRNAAGNCIYKRGFIGPSGPGKFGDAPTALLIFCEYDPGFPAWADF
jgi:hypothetical protein